eukprot:5205945-Heterocapsa_arctica.AAC.1
MEPPGLSRRTPGEDEDGRERRQHHVRLCLAELLGADPADHEGGRRVIIALAVVLPGVPQRLPG